MKVEYVHMMPMPDDTRCAVHDWPDDGLPERLVAAMREMHGKGGINACSDCLTRARDLAKPKEAP